MSYTKIKNLYADQTVLQFKRVYAMEKVHGTLAHISWKNGELKFFAGGSSYDLFIKLFDQESLKAKFTEMGHEDVTVYGEAYGGKIQGMSHTYGKDLCFVAFEVKIDEYWLSVYNAFDVACELGLEFVDYVECDATVEALDAERDKSSAVAISRGMGADKKREGIVIRPSLECKKSNGERVIAKHKCAEFCETKTPRKVGENTVILDNAEAVAFEWVTDMRLSHVLDKLGNPNDMSVTPMVIKAMVEDVLCEGAGEVEDTKAVRKALGKATVKLWKKHVYTVPIDETTS
jgi:hypothetical protein